MAPQEPMAARAVSPSTLPTIMVSTVLYSCWNRLEMRMGSMNSTRLLKMGPCIRFTFIWKRFFFRDWVWVIGFLQLYFYRKTRGRPESSPLFCRFMQLLFTKKLPAAASLVKRQSERPAGRSDCKIKNIFPLKIARAQAAAIPIVLFTAPASQSRGR